MQYPEYQEGETFPYSEGVFHGPYPDTGDPYALHYRHVYAVEEARVEKRISSEGHKVLMRGLHKLFDDIHQERIGKYGGDEIRYDYKGKKYRR